MAVAVAIAIAMLSMFSFSIQVLSAILASEAITWVLVYRKPEYKRICERVRDLSKKLEKEDGRSHLVPVDKIKSYEKGVARMESELKEATAKMNSMKLSTNIAGAVGFYFLYRQVAARWTGTAVATLPFEPLRIVQNISHRGLEDDDLRQCSFGLIYTLCTMGLKQNIPKLLGFAPPRSAYNMNRVAAQAQKDAEKNDKSK